MIMNQRLSGLQRVNFGFVPRRVNGFGADPVATDPKVALASVGSQPFSLFGFSGMKLYAGLALAAAAGWYGWKKWKR